MTALTTAFEGHDITAIEYKGQPVVIARELGAALGYADPGRLAENLSEKWAGDFQEGRDFVKLVGPELASFKAVLSHIPLNRGDVDRTARLLLLTESGAQLAAILSRTPAGTRFRRWIVDVLIPEWRRRNASTSPVAGEALVPRSIEPRVVVELHRRLHRLGKLSPDELALAEVAYAEQLLGRELPELRRVAVRTEVKGRTQVEKREAVLDLLLNPDTARQSSRSIAALAGVSHTYVDQLRRERLPAGVLPRSEVEAAVQELVRRGVITVRTARPESAGRHQTSFRVTLGS